MQNLLSFIAKYYHWLLFLVLEAISVSMLFSYNSYQGSVWVSTANGVAGQMLKWRSDVEHFFSLMHVNEELTTRNIALEQELRELRQQHADWAVDSTELQRQELQRLAALDLLPAKVVANTIDRPDNLLTIDKGKNDGVEADMGVVCGNGLVGVVYLVGDNFSVIIPVLNQSSHISCSIRECGYFGYLTWKGGDPTRAFVEEVPRHAKFKRGDWIETSGYSSIFPPGVSVGRIEKIFNSDNGLFYRLQVKLSTDFSCLRDVCVVRDKRLVERMRLQEAVRDSLSQTQK
jgi:rod shape-determining protein MreC